MRPSNDVHRKFFKLFPGIFLALCITAIYLLFVPGVSVATHTSAGAWVEDPGITGCNHCHNVTIVGGNQSGSNRRIAYSPSNGTTYTAVRRANWSSVVSQMIGKGCPATSAATAYLNACYYTTGTNPNPEGVSCFYVVDTEPPTMPTDVAGTPNPSGTNIALTWTASTDNVGVTGYNIYRDYGSTPIGSSATTSFTNTGLTPSTTYTYEVEAFDAAGNKSPKSTPIQVTTTAPPSDTTPPSQPMNVTAVSNINGTKVFLTWDPSTDDNIGVASYNIYRDSGSTPIGSSTSITFLDSGVSPATSYSYEIEAVDAAGNLSTKSVPAMVTTNAGFLLTDVTTVCTLPSPGITGFVISPNFVNDGRIYVATGDNAIYKCTKSGSTWTRSGNLWPYSGSIYDDNPLYDVRMLAMTPNFSSNNTIFAAAGSGMYRSTNGGSSWGQINGMMYGFNMTSVTVSPNYASNTTVFSGNWKDTPGQGGGLQTWDPMLYQSTNGGGSWSARKTLTSASEGTGFTSIDISSNNHGYAGVTETGTTTYKGVWKSTNGGTSWTRVQTALNVSDISVSPSYATDCKVFAVGDTQEIYRSTDCGANWTPIAANDNPGYSIDAIDLSPNFGTDGDALFCSSGAGSNKYGLKRSLDEGATWYDAAFAGAGCTDVHYSPDFTTSGIVFASDDTKIYQMQAVFYPDGDGDGWDTIADCNDSDANVYPGAAETTNDGIDQDCNGRDLAVEVLISGMVGSDEQTQTVAWNTASSEYLVLWQDFRSGTGNPDIYGARLDRNGNLVAGNLPIVTNSARQAGPWVTYGGGGYLSVWIDQRTSATTGTDVYGAWILPDGTVSSEFVVTNAAANQRAASVVYDPSGGSFLVTWIDDRNGTSNIDIWGAMVLPGGVVSGSPFAMVTAAGNQRGPYVRYDYGNNQYFMIWFDNRGGNNDAYGSRVSASGVLLDGSGLVISNATGNQNNPRITDRRPADGIGNYVVSWVDFRNGSVPDIYGALVDGSGMNVSGDFAVSGGSSDQRAASVDVDYVRTKGAMVAWLDNRTTNADIYRAQVGQSGVVTGDYPVAGNATGLTGDQRGPLFFYTTVGSADNGFLLLWRDNRSGAGYDLYGIKVWP